MRCSILLTVGLFVATSMQAAETISVPCYDAANVRREAHWVMNTASGEYYWQPSNYWTGGSSYSVVASEFNLTRAIVSPLQCYAEVKDFSPPPFIYANRNKSVTESRICFAFTVPSSASPYRRAQLRMKIKAEAKGEVVTFSEMETSYQSIIHGNNGTLLPWSSVYPDFADGAVYGQYKLSDLSEDGWVTIDLSSEAISKINDVHGQLTGFCFGMVLTSAKDYAAIAEEMSGKPVIIYDDPQHGTYHYPHQSVEVELNETQFEMYLDLDAPYSDSAKPLASSPADGPCLSDNCDDQVAAQKSPGASYVDNVRLGHRHSASDYAINSVDGMGCSSCGASGEVGGTLPSLKIKRIHRYDNIDWHASFGPGVFSAYDLSLTLSAASNTAELFDPSMDVELELDDSGNTGVYLDLTYSAVRDLRLFDAEGLPTNSESTAATAVVTRHDGQTDTFEIFTLESGITSNYSGRLVRRADRNGNAIVITYVNSDPKTSDATLGYDRGKLWRIASINDGLGKTASLTYGFADGQWVIQSISLPNGSIIAYHYDADRLVGVDQIDLPDGTISTFKTSYDRASQTEMIAYDDAAAEGTHRRKKAFYSTGSLNGINQPFNRVRRILNGEGEVAYKSWTTASGTDKRIYVFEGGSERGGGSLMRFDTIDGVPDKTWRSLSFDLTKPANTYSWELVEDVTTDSNRRVTERAQNSGRRISYLRDVTTGAVAGRQKYSADGALFAQTSTTYNSNLQPLEQTDELGRRTINIYDAFGNWLSKTVAAGTADEATWSWTYNTRGQVLTATDANGNVTDYAYDTAGRLLTVTEPRDRVGDERAVIRYQYDSAGRLHESTDASDRSVIYNYDERNRIASIEYGNSSSDTFIYGKGVDVNLQIRHVGRNGIAETATYDQAGRRIMQTLAADTPVTGHQLWSYVRGRDIVSSFSNLGDKITYTYDHRFRRTTSTLATPSGSLIETIAYDPDDRIEFKQDPYGRRSYYMYDRNDDLTRTVRELVPGALSIPLPRDERYAYLRSLSRILTANPAYIIEDSSFDLGGQIISVTNGRGVIGSFQYDFQGRLITQTEAVGLPEQSVTQYTYDDQGNRLSVTNPRGIVSTFTYTGRNLLASSTEADGTVDQATALFSYSLTGKRASVTDPRSLITTFHYADCCDRLIGVMDHLGFITSYSYDAIGNRISVTDPNGLSTSIAYDARNRIATVTNAVGEIIRYTYDDNLTDGIGLDAAYSSAVVGATGTNTDGSALLVTDPLGNTKLEVRDGLSRTVRMFDGNNLATVFTFDAIIGGLVESTRQDALSHLVRSRVDGAGRQRQVVDAYNFVTTCGYDAVGNMVSQRDGNGVGIDCEYDARNRRTSCMDTHGETIRATYDSVGNQLTATDARGYATSFTYDARDRTHTMTDRVNAVTEYAYDADSNLVKLTDAESQDTQYFYNQRNLLTQETYADTGTRFYAYDAGRRLTTRTDQANAVTQFVYDNANRLIARQYPDGLGDTLMYDGSGRLTRATSARYGTEVTRAYDSGNRLLSESQTVDDQRYQVSYAYDSANRVTTITYPDGAISARTYTVRDQLATVAYGGSNVMARTYDPGLRMSTSTLGNGLVETRTYRTDNLVDSIAIPNVTGLSYTYNQAKSKLSESDSIITSPSHSLDYDNEQRLTSWSTSTSSQSWSLSAVGDWDSTSRDGVTETRVHAATHKITSITVAGTTTPLTHDVAGNLTQNSNGATYVWDTENRLALASIRDDNEGIDGAARYRYDALGRRLQKNVYGRSTTFIHSGAQVIEEVDAMQLVPASEASDDGTTANAEQTPPGGAIIPSALVRVNFQPSRHEIPAGFVADKGRAFGVKTGNTFSYGWNVARTSAAVARGEHPLPQYDTYNGIQPNGPAGTWEIALANGTYPVVVVMGDCASKMQTNNVVIEGEAQTDTDPAEPDGGYTRGDFDGYSSLVTVTDGRLSISAGTGSLTPKLCFIEIGQPGAALDQATIDRLAAQVGLATDRTGGVAFPKPQPNPRQYVYATYVDEPVMLIAGQNKYYYHTNTTNSVHAITDSTGSVVERYRYDAYGKRSLLAVNGMVIGSESGYANNVGFTGRYHDQETNLIFFRNRYLDHRQGRFISRDPLNYIDGYSMYGAYFVPNANDPFGLCIQGIDPDCSGQMTAAEKALVEHLKDADRLKSAGNNASELELAAHFSQRPGIEHAIAQERGWYDFAASKWIDGLVSDHSAILAFNEGGRYGQSLGADGVITILTLGMSKLYPLFRGLLNSECTKGSTPTPTPTPTQAPQQAPQSTAPSQGAPAKWPRWKVGDSPTQPTAKGNEPAWSTQRGRTWKNEAALPGAEEKWGKDNVARMRQGLAPERYNEAKGGMESMDLSHEPIPQRDGGTETVPRWPQDHAEVDPYRYPGY
jgi:RHS repeat-associated protein